MVAAFKKATGIKALIARKSSGESFAQFRAEAANPSGDIWASRRRTRSCWRGERSSQRMRCVR